ncbi:hypothetical protein [Actinomarinicola tropica]|uniref:Uncharacterized protein n=1 Tax=Actinomarinicola tropica TaxID=2789776 RepID=A0A5Q2RDK3_9ACTN|nr:hypothetical protein [Actinomarinicola tropica]QGG94948.1 hypothetical protein GH723_07400 [Actinomarinicola tropica]
MEMRPTFHPINPGRDVARTWEPVQWLTVQVAYTGHIVGFWVNGGYTRSDALEALVAMVELATPAPPDSTRAGGGS